ncbi:MAG: hypothetical protein II240_02965, partial [Bacteroidaceae bacterium]|nr:hypothetical protein [Bacteroidaceae bacterium]
MNKMFVSLAGEEEAMLGVVGYYDEHGDADEKMESCLLMGSVYRDMGDAPMALEWFGKAVEHGNKGAKNTTLLAKIHGQKAELFRNQRLYNDALKECAEMKRYSELLLNKDLVVNANSFIASLLFSMNDYDSVIVVNNECYDILMSEFNDSVNAAIVLASSISTYICKKDYDNARRLMPFYEEYSGHFDEYGNILKGKESYYIDKGDMYRGLDSLDSAETYYRKAICASDWNNKTMGYYGLMETFKAKGDKDSIVKYSMLTCTAYSNLFDELQTNTVQQVEGTYNYDRYRLKSVEKELEAERSRNALIVVLGIIAIAVCSALMFWNRWQNRKKLEVSELMRGLERAKAEAYLIATERRELASELEANKKVVDELKRRVEESGATESVAEREESKIKLDVLQQETDRLRKVLSDTENKYSEILSQKKNIVTSMLLKFDARKERPSNEEWAELERYVSELYPLFLHNLNSALPGVKTENIRIAILVKLELAPTQIAFLTSKTIQAVSNARCRMFLKVHGGDK